ncbi:predicted protein [Histoplasma capsulatum G186AR]|uniref:Uncharacterized protein n=1 Tax=Ajellomyces capsulatus (strain G186AR / H82 / ATCC MYA-2454 / RMSCC 2432) TaxID=447093 RepID=C0NAR5_AJECG|nr:uncharacterized protein HCBG_00211 [Histoplasma capsulatum G186AR]EEH10756.1 predicted protein [Histoplasma capsulatum G186AR]
MCTSNQDGNSYNTREASLKTVGFRRSFNFDCLPSNPIYEGNTSHNLITDTVNPPGQSIKSLPRRLDKPTTSVTIFSVFALSKIPPEPGPNISQNVAQLDTPNSSLRNG